MQLMNSESALAIESVLMKYKLPWTNWGIVHLWCCFNSSQITSNRWQDTALGSTETYSLYLEEEKNYHSSDCWHMTLLHLLIQLRVQT
jgi:hypothetical protein